MRGNSRFTRAGALPKMLCRFPTKNRLNPQSLPREELRRELETLGGAGWQRVQFLKDNDGHDARLA